ncbi:TRAP transporter large permease [Natribacillus halophilus]|uniref:C4-dicarboxylate transporter, DctM subunit n=1 Tax=Natribacillus halophilus TaxID=549003 RepID=A0A1G8MK90_9BACI|nr:TRAP transporter large permease [Natribacillus halophilus]SDI68332.1 C4-dicarboxylate transporter, DctM subunit [Natribacillus halophilus]
MASLLFILLGVFLLLGVPIAFALGLASVITVWQGDFTQMVVVVQQIFNSINSFPLMAIPFFILAGYLMQSGGISERLIGFSNTLVGNISGGLAIVAIITSMFFAAISGSGAATTAAIGSILIPAMVTKGYDEKFAAANQASAGALGVIIPPSIPLILYAVSANVSVGDMFIAGILPGILVTMSLIIFAYLYSKVKGYVGVKKTSFKEIFIAGRKAILALFMPFLVLGGIYGGIFTPTEAAVVAVIYAFIVGVIIYREIKLRDIIEIFRKSASMTAIILSVIGTAGLYGYIMQNLRVPNMMSDAVVGTVASPIIFLLLSAVLLLIVGMFIEAAAAILIFVPILLPIAVEFGVDPVHFGIIMVVNLAMGLFTPPVGLNLFVASQISNVSIGRLTTAVIPFVAILLINVLIISFMPFLSTWLPSLR